MSPALAGRFPTTAPPGKPQTFFSCGERGLLFIVVRRLLIAVASLVVEHGLLGMWASVVVVCGFSSYGLRTLECRLSSCGAQA